MNFVLAKKTILVNQNVMGQLDLENLTIYDSDPVKNLNKNIQHSCNLTILANASMHIRSRNSSEATYITFLRPHLNNQLKFSKLLLFRDGIT